MDKLKDMAGGTTNPLDVKQFLEGVTWPIGKDDLVNVLRQNNAPDSVVSKVKGSGQSQFQDEGDLLSKIGI
jgi:hypothetical protein